jgi:hypothetical protein
MSIFLGVVPGLTVYINFITPFFWAVNLNYLVKGAP